MYPEDQAVLLTEQALTTPEAREHAAEILFESLDVPRLHIAPQPQLALYADYALRQGEGAAAALTGLVMESGDGPTHITPLVDGYLLTPGCRTLGAGGAHVTSRVQELLRARSGVAAARGVTVQQAVEVKHRHCYVCTDPEAAPGAEPTGGRQHGCARSGAQRNGRHGTVPRGMGAVCRLRMRGPLPWENPSPNSHPFPNSDSCLPARRRRGKKTNLGPRRGRAPRSCSLALRPCKARLPGKGESAGGGLKHPHAALKPLTTPLPHPLPPHPPTTHTHTHAPPAELEKML